MNNPDKPTIRALLRRPAFRLFFRLFFQYKWLYAAVIVLQLAGTVSALLFAETIRRLFDRFSDLSQPVLTNLIVSLVCFMAMGLAFQLTERVVNQVLNTNVVFRMRQLTMDQLTRLSLSYHENRHRSNALNIMYNELEVFKHFVVFDVLKLISLPVTFAIVGFYLLRVEPLLGLVAIAAGPLQLISSLVLGGTYKKIVGQQNDIGHQVFFHIDETLGGIREVKMNRLESPMRDKFARVCAQGIKFWVSFEKVTAVREAVRELPDKLGYLIGISVGAVLIAEGKIGPGGLVAFMTLLDKTSAPFATMVGIISSLQRALTGADNLLTVMELPPENEASGVTLEPEPPSVVFEHVSFSYDEGKPVLHDVSFSIPAGATAALVGPSGGGKSTIVKLLYRFYQPDAGTICLQNRPLDEYSLESLRSSLGTVAQDVHLFDGSIKDNIEIGRMGAGDDEIRLSAEWAQAHDFIARLPEGFDTKVGERGIKLSQGQKQRIAIARTILRRPSLLVLDEPTSALDVETEERLQSNLPQWAHKCTTIVIAHRLSTIRDADLVLFLEDGRICEAGTPKALLAAGGRFAAFWSKQLAEREIAAAHVKEEHVD